MTTVFYGFEVNLKVFNELKIDSINFYITYRIFIILEFSNVPFKGFILLKGSVGNPADELLKIFVMILIDVEKHLWFFNIKTEVPCFYSEIKRC